jgi:hypothetical protein
MFQTLLPNLFLHYESGVFTVVVVVAVAVDEIEL